MLEIRWYGRGGQGAFTAARLLGMAASVYGSHYALAFPSFGPERRGAPVWSFTRIDDKPIIDRSQPSECNYLIILDGSLITPDTCNVLRDDGIVILNTARPEKYQFIKQKLVTVDATKIALDILKRPLTNVAMLGAFAGATGSVDLDTIEKTLKESFSPALFEKNKQVLHEAYNQVKGVD
jgi:pyruvate ferredoxin oxidoreductase gamma subunit